MDGLNLISAETSNWTLDQSIPTTRYYYSVDVTAELDYALRAESDYILEVRYYDSNDLWILTTDNIVADTEAKEIITPLDCIRVEIYIKKSDNTFFEIEDTNVTFVQGWYPTFFENIPDYLTFKEGTNNTLADFETRISNLENNPQGDFYVLSPTDQRLLQITFSDNASKFSSCYYFARFELLQNYETAVLSQYPTFADMLDACYDAYEALRLYLGNDIGVITLAGPSWTPTAIIGDLTIDPAIMSQFFTKFNTFQANIHPIQDAISELLLYICLETDVITEVKDDIASILGYDKSFAEWVEYAQINGGLFDGGYLNNDLIDSEQLGVTIGSDFVNFEFLYNNIGTSTSFGGFTADTDSFYSGNKSDDDYTDAANSITFSSTNGIFGNTWKFIDGIFTTKDVYIQGTVLSVKGRVGLFNIETSTDTYFTEVDNDGDEVSRSTDFFGVRHVSFNWQHPLISGRNIELGRVDDYDILPSVKNNGQDDNLNVINYYSQEANVNTRVNYIEGRTEQNGTAYFLNDNLVKEDLAIDLKGGISYDAVRLKYSKITEDTLTISKPGYYFIAMPTSCSCNITIDVEANFVVGDIITIHNFSIDEAVIQCNDLSIYVSANASGGLYGLPANKKADLLFDNHNGNNRWVVHEY